MTERERYYDHAYRRTHVRTYTRLESVPGTAASSAVAREVVEGEIRSGGTWIRREGHDVEAVRRAVAVAYVDHICPAA